MDCPQEWPVPVVPVQTLSESQTIPDRYVKPPSQRPSVDPGDDDVSIPVIDLAAMLAADGGGVASCPATVEAISDACREWGFFQVVNHGVSLELVRRFREVWRGFFHLPLEEKRRYANSPKTYEGYGSRLGVDKGVILDWGDYYFLHLLPPRLKDHNKWPALPPCLRDTTDEYGVEVRKLCRRMMETLSLGLGVDADCLQKAFGGDDEGICVRINYYPKCPQPDLTLGLSPHSDPGGMTVLLVDDHVKGLQVRKNDAWITINPLPNAFIINIGDQIQVLSNATYKSIEHRVIVNAKEERLSVAFFYNPRSDIPVGPLPELVPLGPAPLYQPMTFDEYRLFIREKGLHGKSQVDSLKRSD